MPLIDILQDDATIKRFWSRVEINVGDKCWPWKGGRVPYGYGAFCPAPHAKRNFGAHRIAWIIVNRRLIPNGLVIRHACDNPPCVNPKHLEVGTTSDNIRDSYVRRRRPTNDATLAAARAVIPRGTAHWKAKINDDIVRSIRASHEAGEPNGAIAATYGVDRSLISRILNRHIWAHVA